MGLFLVCLFTIFPKTFLVNKELVSLLYSSHLTLPVYPSSSFLRPWGSMIELVKKESGGPSFQTPWEPGHTKRTMRLKPYWNCKGFVFSGWYHNVVLLYLTRILVYVNKKMRFWKVSFARRWIMFLRERESFTCAYIVVWWDKRERSVLSGKKGVFNGSSVSWKNAKPDGTGIGCFS